MKGVKRHIGIGTVSIFPFEKRLINDVLTTNRLSYGPYTRKFERQFARLHKRKFAFFCNSGTSALQIGLHALKTNHRWKDGDEVLVPAITFIASPNVVLRNNLKPVFVDIESEFYEIDPMKIEEKVTKRTRAIMPVHLFGQPCDMKPILRIAKKYKLKIIEDSCQTVLVKYKREVVGSWGEISCFSTYATHLVVTGVGGLATTNSHKLAQIMRSLLNHGRDQIYISIDDDDTEDAGRLKEIIKKRFKFIHLGYSYRLTELEGALGLGGLKRIRKIISKRQRNAKYLIRGLKKFDDYLQLPKIRAETEHAFMLFPLLIKNKSLKIEKLLLFLELNGIETRFMLPILNQPIYRKILGNIEKEYPIAKRIGRNGFFIGCHQDLKEQDLDYIIETFKVFFKKEGL